MVFHFMRFTPHKNPHKNPLQSAQKTVANYMNHGRMRIDPDA
jgi:hypothetical protein